MATRGNDVLRGTDAADILAGGRGDDVIYGFDAERTGAGVGKIVAERVGRGLDDAVFAGSAPGRPDELFVVRKDVGTIRILDPETGRHVRFLNIPDADLAEGGEQGLLGLAFHPDYQSNGRFFVHLVNADGDIEIREYARSAGNADRAGPEPVRTVITVPHPTHTNHNGGALAFGPDDGYLYIAIGDGGGRNDPGNNAQNTGNLLGTILRLDVDGDDFPGNALRNYAVPADNPFVGAPGANEIWAFGLRNPWRITFDAGGDLYIADVGQSAREEVNVQPADSPGGENYGWDLAEGTLGNPPPGATGPIFDYGRDFGGSITGGYVYRGGEASLDGAYFFADFLSGAIATLRVEDGGAAGVTTRTTQIATPDAGLRLIASFGVDGNGSLYVVSLAGDIFRLEMTAHAGDLADKLSGGQGADRLYGGPGDDRLDGGKGSDFLRGGFGDDILRGGARHDRIHGDAGDDKLYGDGGNDRLHGGPGADAFVFNTAPDRGRNVDRIVDFAPDTDHLVLKRTVFPAIGASLSAQEFHVGPGAADPSHHVIYNPETGTLSYDPNGDADGGRTRVAELNPGLALDSGDFMVF